MPLTAARGWLEPLGLHQNPWILTAKVCIRNVSDMVTTQREEVHSQSPGHNREANRERKQTVPMAPQRPRSLHTRRTFVGSNLPHFPNLVWISRLSLS